MAKKPSKDETAQWAVQWTEAEYADVKLSGKAPIIKRGTTMFSVVSKTEPTISVYAAPKLN